LYAQKVSLEYDILKKGDKIGLMKLTSQKEGNNFLIKMDSNVEINLLSSIVIQMHEEALYHKDKLIYSTGKRVVNGNIKADIQTKSSDNFYYLINKGKTSTLQVSTISNNLLLMYFKEPVNTEEVYSDTFQKFLKINHIQPHQIKLNLPTGDFNEYFFRNGVCNKVIIHSTFYTIEMQLKKYQ
jgi:hypothetical protein